jgi:hypothetical protein
VLASHAKRRRAVIPELPHRPRETQSRCQERTGIDANAVAAPAFRALCETGQGTYVEEACPRENVVAGCTVSGNVIDWFYAPLTIDEVRALELCDDPFAP